jgi:hypothetical protein
MIERTSRRAVGELLRHLAAGQITNDQFEDRLPRGSSDAAVAQIRHQAWFLYSDLREYRFVGRDRLSDEHRREVARWILFLQSDLEYQWPRMSAPVSALLFVANLCTLGWVGRDVVRRFKRHGDFDVWPFIRRSECEATLGEPKYLAGAV